MPVSSAPVDSGGNIKGLRRDSRGDVDYIGQTPVEMDFDGDGKLETLEITVEKENPNQTTLSFVIGSCTKKIESPWDDGVGVYVTDFDTADAFLDLYVKVLGTDFSAIFFIYEYDGKAISHISTFQTAEAAWFDYDTAGTLFYKGLSGETECHYRDAVADSSD